MAPPQDAQPDVGLNEPLPSSGVNDRVPFGLLELRYSGPFRLLVRNHGAPFVGLAAIAH